MLRWMTIGLCALVPMATCAPDNLLDNPSLEEVQDGNIIGWETQPPGSAEARDDGGHEGQRYARFVDTGDNTNLVLESKRIPARPGGMYRASAWFRTSDDCDPGVYLNFYDDLGTRVHHRYQRAEGPTDGWVRVEVATAAPPDSLEVSTTLYAYMGDVGTFDADYVAMTVEGGAEPGTGRVPRAGPGEKPMVAIATRLELFVDGFIVDGLSGDATRRLHHPVRREVVHQFDKPWEGPYCAYCAVVRDEKICLYYRGWPDLDGPDCTCVIESDDGIHFTRPNVGRFEWQGSKENNIVWLGAGCHNFTPFLDENPACPAEHRYKALASAGPKASLVPFVSADGLHWEKLQEEPVITKGAFDSQNLAFWDPVREEYVEYHRGFKDGVRDVMTSTSKDFVNWTEPQWLDYGDAPKEHFYTNAALPYFRAPHIHLAFPCRFVPSRKKVPGHEVSGINDGVPMRDTSATPPGGGEST